MSDQATDAPCSHEKNFRKVDGGSGGEGGQPFYQKGGLLPPGCNALRCERESAVQAAAFTDNRFDNALQAGHDILRK